MLETIRNKCVKLLGGYTMSDLEVVEKNAYQAGINTARDVARELGRIKATSIPVRNDAGALMWNNGRSALRG